MQIGRDDLEKIYEWRQAQASNMGGACFTLAGLILSPLLAAVFDANASVETWSVAAYALGAVLAIMAGVAWHREAHRLQLEYAVKVAPGVVTW